MSHEIADLSAENRRSRSAQREQELVRLRHRAFRRTDREVAPASWPPTLPDPWPGLAGPPEVRPDELTVETLGGGILHHGCLLVRGLLSTGHAWDLAACVDAAYQARESLAGGAPDPEGWYVPFEDPVTGWKLPDGERRWYQESGGLLAADSPRALFQITERLDGMGLLPVLEQYMGERPVLSIEKTTLRCLRGSHPTWHQDGAFMGEDLRTVNLWLSLSDCGGDTDAPGLDIIPKRFHHVLETCTHGAFFPGQVGQGLVDLMSTDAPLLTPRFAPGDALLFDDLFLHRTSVREGLTRQRRALEAWFFASSRFPSAYAPLVV